jgi:enoyl-CoA hydratase
MTELTLCNIASGIATITLSRPGKLNAINYAMIDALMAVLDRLKADVAVRAVVITGCGKRALSAGGDIYNL